jgi:hypothetical protein
MCKICNHIEKWISIGLQTLNIEVIDLIDRINFKCNYDFGIMVLYLKCLICLIYSQY